jgi:hypothetical protein
MLFMRTTVEIPPALMRAAKARAAERGESLESLLTRAVAAELGVASGRRAPAARVKLPLFGSAGLPVHLLNADLERALAGSELTRSSRTKPARRSRPHLPPPPPRTT